MTLLPCWTSFIARKLVTQDVYALAYSTDPIATRVEEALDVIDASHEQETIPVILATDRIGVSLSFNGSKDCTPDALLRADGCEFVAGKKK